MKTTTFGWLPCPNPSDLEQGLQVWEEAFPRRMRVERIGHSAGGRPLMAVTISDADVPDEVKQRVLFTACHAGPERNACTGLLHFVKWLIGDDAQAVAYCRQYAVTIIPCADPDGYAAQPPVYSQPNPYTDWSWDGPGESPEARALFDLMERLQPEAHVDMHGLPYKEGTMWESTGISWAAALSRCHEPELPRFIDNVVERQGFLITRGEADAGRVLSSAPVPEAGDHYYLQSCAKNIACVSYHRYHSLGFIMEAGFDESIVWRARAVLEAGLRRWRYQRLPALPCDHVTIWGSTQLAAWGETAAQRRASRVELWRRSAHTAVGAAHPEHRGTLAAVAAFTPRGAQLLGHPAPDGWLATWQSETWPALFDRLRGERAFDVDGLMRWRRHRPALPDGAPLTDACALCGPHAAEGAASPPEHGVLIRMLIPYRDAEVRDIALNGYPLAESATDGYTITRDPGCVVHVAIPPGKVGDLHLATCRYESPQIRRAGFTPEDWMLHT